MNVVRMLLLMLMALLMPIQAWAAAGQDLGATVHNQNEHRAWIMLDASTGTGDGVWIDWRGFTLGTLHVDGISGDTLDVRGSNAATIPANDTHGEQVGSNITADGFVTITGPYKWLKVRHTVDGGGTVTAILAATTIGGGGSTASSGAVTISTDPVPVAGKKTNNNAAPGATNVGAITCIANAAAPSYTEGNLVLLRCDRSGSQAVYTPDVGETNHRKLSTASTNATSVTSANTILTGFDCQNPSTTTAAYLHVYNKASAPSPAADTALVIGTWDIGASPASGGRGGIVKDFVNGLGGFTDGLAYTITGSKVDTDTTAAVADVRCNLQYHLKVN